MDLGGPNLQVREDEAYNEIGASEIVHFTYDDIKDVGNELREQEEAAYVGARNGNVMELEWTIREHEQNVVHQELVGEGGYGQVHKVRFIRNTFANGVRCSRPVRER